MENLQDFVSKSFTGDRVPNAIRKEHLSFSVDELLSNGEDLSSDDEDISASMMASNADCPNPIVSSSHVITSERTALPSHITADCHSDKCASSSPAAGSAASVFTAGTSAPSATHQHSEDTQPLSAPSPQDNTKRITSRQLVPEMCTAQESMTLPTRVSPTRSPVLPNDEDSHGKLKFTHLLNSAQHNS